MATRTRKTSKPATTDTATDTAVVHYTPDTAGVPAQDNGTVMDGTVIDLTNAPTLPSKQAYATARTSFANASGKAASVLLSIVQAEAYANYVGTEDEPGTPEALFADFLGGLSLPGKSEVRNEIILTLTMHGHSMQAVADMLNMSKPGVQYVISKAKAAELPAGDTGEGESGEGDGEPAQDKPATASLKVAKDDKERAVALLTAAGIDIL